MRVRTATARQQVWVLQSILVSRGALQAISLRITLIIRIELSLQGRRKSDGLGSLVDY